MPFKRYRWKCSLCGWVRYVVTAPKSDCMCMGKPWSLIWIMNKILLIGKKRWKCDIPG